MNEKTEISSNAPSRKLGFYVVIGVLAICLIIALVGVGILNWQKSSKNAEIRTLRTELSSTHREGWSGNPILETETRGRQYVISHLIRGERGYVDLSIMEGKVAKCYYVKNGIGGQECVVNGLEGEVYKVSEIFAREDMPDTEILCFIMTDGQVFYIGIQKAFSSDNWNISGKLKVDKPVVDIVEVEIDFISDSTDMKRFLIVFNDRTFTEFTFDMMEG